MKCFWRTRSCTQYNRISIALEILCFTVPLAIPVALELSVWIGVAGWGCPISASVIRSTAPSLALWKRPPDLASVAEYITFFMMLLTVWMALLGVGVVVGGFVGSVERDVSVKCPPTRLQDLGSDPYDASLYMWSIMLLATYRMVASGWVAT